MIDIVLLIVIAGSALLGLLRGFVGTLVSTAAWLLAGWATFEFGGQAGAWLADSGQPTMAEAFGGYALTFVMVMVTVTLVGAVARTLVKSAGLSGVDRMLGATLGLLRGGFLACLLVLLMGFTPLPAEASWHQSRVMPMLLPAAHWMRSKLPHWSVPQMDFRNGSAAGDNGDLGSLPVPMLEQAMQQAIDTAKGGLSQRGSSSSAQGGQDPAGIGPGSADASVRSGLQDPANVESNGSDPANIETAKQRTGGRQQPRSQ